MSKLNDKQVKQIIAEHAEGSSTRVLAEKYHVCQTTIRNTIKKDPDFAQKCAEKKRENVESVLSFMESKTNDVCVLIDKLLDALGDDDKIASATLQQLATAMGIVIDKFTAREQLKSMIGASERTDDPLTASLREEAAKLDDKR